MFHSRQKLSSAKFVRSQISKSGETNYAYSIGPRMDPCMVPESLLNRGENSSLFVQFSIASYALIQPPEAWVLNIHIKHGTVQKTVREKI